MKKTISILSITSIALAVLSLLLAVGLLFIFWEPVCLLISAPEAVVDAGPIIPIGNMVYMVGCLIVAVLVCICAKSNRSVVLEIMAIVFLSVILPALAWRLSMAQTSQIGRTMGAATLTALSVATDVSGFARGLMDVSVALCLVACGMSISEKAFLIKDRLNANHTV